MEPRKGEIYRHFKGQDYKIVATARDSEHWEKKLVIYHPVGNPNEVSARPLGMWTEIVSKPEYNNYKGPRFRKI